MDQGSGSGGTITLWRATAQAELDLVATAGWRAWPASFADRPFEVHLERRPAELVARTSLAATAGVGYVTSFEVRSAFVEHCLGHRIGSGSDAWYSLPEAEVAGLNENLVSVIIEQAEYRAALDDREFADARAAALPSAWRGYLQRSAWFRRGWQPTGCYLWLYPPREGIELAEAWGEDAVGAHPGIAIIGGNGSREHLAIDLRKDDPPVLLVDAYASEGWADALVQANSVAEFTGRVEAGSFDFSWD
ncbi:hypothetical protein ACFQZ4_48315 [Catellatospora coxensis]|uniref:SMI1/KNR4 family protein n=1 Tax=Catellatospora coxensis TaxID=310354 RepID=A0A8J3KIX5_9ACTN|nr:hypothetical protein [Catellatospora coxensis]GIG03897.1 hypothetical protein Cco03nite_05970 [Catellatospora coxensis]